MKKLIIALGLISILVATTVPSWGESKPMYVCYLEKTKQTRYVDKVSDCKSSEIAMAVSPSTKTGSAESQDQQSSKKDLKDSPALSGAILESSGPGSFGSGW
jgi:hypothetical protein